MKEREKDGGRRRKGDKEKVDWKTEFGAQFRILAKRGNNAAPVTIGLFQALLDIAPPIPGDPGPGAVLGDEAQGWITLSCWTMPVRWTPSRSSQACPAPYSWAQEAHCLASPEPGWVRSSRVFNILYSPVSGPWSVPGKPLC